MSAHRRSEQRPRTDLVSGLASTVSWPARILGPRALAAVRRSKGAPAGLSYDSPQFRDGSFRNREPARVLEAGGGRSIAVEIATKGNRGKPAGEVPLVRPTWPEQAADCAATWLGHATVLLEIGGHWVLADPVWSERCSPSSGVGPRRTHPVPARIEDLPRLDAVLISHDHYDHLDTASIAALTRTQQVPFVVPLGVGAHLRRWAVPEDRVVELDWGDTFTLGELTLTCTEARHFSGRFFDENPTLWSSWLVQAGGRTVFFGGDGGYCTAFADLGAEHDRIDLTVMPVGAYDTRWPDIHMDPAEAVRAHLDLRGDVLLPIHWGTFDLAFHPWAEPADRVRREAAAHDVRLAQPRPGERWVAGEDLPTDEWWAGLRR
ncbi:MAG: MBL fold metallo-hydrolase [Nocardioides sp.]|nr:MBL fold metallo-hydrolase [Nocardioides sp.]